MEKIKHIASISMGKDSVAMLIKILEYPDKFPLDEIVFYDTGMEFNQTYEIRNKIEELCKINNIKYTELHPSMPFIDKMIHYSHQTRKGEIKNGYGWCGGMCRWGTTEKIRTIDKYCKDAIQYIGIAYDETERWKRLPPNKLTPLVNLELTESDCIKICEKHGLLNPLYKYLKRVSCWCCRNKNLKELLNYKLHLPKYFNALCELEKLIGEPMKPPLYLNERFKNYD